MQYERNKWTALSAATSGPQRSASWKCENLAAQPDQINQSPLTPLDKPPLSRLQQPVDRTSTTRAWLARQARRLLILRPPPLATLCRGLGEQVPAPSGDVRLAADWLPADRRKDSSSPLAASRVQGRPDPARGPSSGRPGDELRAPPRRAHPMERRSGVS